MNKRFKPQYLPYNDAAHALVEALAVELVSDSVILGGTQKVILNGTQNGTQFVDR